MRFLLCTALTCALAGPALAAADAAPVVDHAELFSPAAVTKANRLLKEVADRYGIQLRVETLAKLPPKNAESFSGLTHRGERVRFLEKLAEERADEQDVDGLFVLVTTEPPSVSLVACPLRRYDHFRSLEEGGGLSPTTRTELRKPFVKELQADPNRALLALVDHFRLAVAQRVQVDPAPLPPVPALLLVGGLLAAWLLLSLLRRLLPDPATGRPPDLYRPAVLTSLFGTPAGFWVYDRLFRLERPRTPPPPPEPPPEEGAGPPAPLVEETA
jgi:hypothetical protein